MINSKSLELLNDLALKLNAKAVKARKQSEKKFLPISEVARRRGEATGQYLASSMLAYTILKIKEIEGIK